MKDYKLKQRNLRVSHTLGWSWSVYNFLRVELPWYPPTDPVTSEEDLSIWKSFSPWLPIVFWQFLGLVNSMLNIFLVHRVRVYWLSLSLTRSLSLSLTLSLSLSHSDTLTVFISFLSRGPKTEFLSNTLGTLTSVQVRSDMGVTRVWQNASLRQRLSLTMNIRESISGEMHSAWLREVEMMMIFLQQNKKRRETGEKCHGRTMMHSKPIHLSTWRTSCAAWKVLFIYCLYFVSSETRTSSSMFITS